MPASIPQGAAAGLPPARMIDPRGHRFGAGLSAILIAVSFLLNAPLGVASRLPVDRGQRRVRPEVLDLRRDLAPDREDAAPRPKIEMEHEYPPRFAQVLRQRRPGARPDLLSSSACRPSAGGPVGRVAALQTLLAVTGYCLGCRLYFLRWWVPDLVTRLWTRGRSRLDVSTPRAASRVDYR